MNRKISLAAVVDYFRVHPGATRVDAAKALGVVPGTIHWHLKKAERLGLVRKSRSHGDVETLENSEITKQG